MPLQKNPKSWVDVVIDIINIFKKIDIFKNRRNMQKSIIHLSNLSMNSVYTKVNFFDYKKVLCEKSHHHGEVKIEVRSFKKHQNEGS